MKAKDIKKFLEFRKKGGGMKKDIDNKEIGYLKDDIKEIIVETDEKDPKVIARINEILCPSEGYRVRVKFSEN
ncbi:hypothetical protein [Anaerococcus sp. AGMB09787]|uniref:hypothetical protein n=1 Tax=Anaerococcus sp. AGMB09787 TaxID=2922869 RepID=UPI001FAEEC61|nr:hypothetical protein [Anaerococcus sp. AGMB09787]